MLSLAKRRLSPERLDDDHRDDEGFTLIELMVVVLIIAILLAIAIPTFLGARSRAQDRAAQSNLRNALTAAKTAYTDTQSYAAAATPASLAAIEPSLSFQSASTNVTAGSNQVSVSNAGDTNQQTVLLAALSATGTCWYLMDIAQTPSFTLPTGVSGPGTWYAHNSTTTCNANGLPTGVTWGTHF
jgi:type IV pilus assembly protein PilA